MALLTHERPAPSFRTAPDLHTTVARAARRIGAAARQVYPVVLVFALFGAIMISTIVLRVAIWWPTFHR